MRKFTRRDLPVLLGGVASALKLDAQAAPGLVEQARESKRAAAEELARVELPVATEPAFRFQA